MKLEFIKSPNGEQCFDINYSSSRDKGEPIKVDFDPNKSSNLVLSDIPPESVFGPLPDIGYYKLLIKGKDY